MTVASKIEGALEILAAVGIDVDAMTPQNRRHWLIEALKRQREKEADLRTALLKNSGDLIAKRDLKHVLEKASVLQRKLSELREATA